jgi:uncharacterized membrane protein YoaK (UPF0700 family)
MVEYGLIISSSVGHFLHRLTYDPTLWGPALLILAAVTLVVYGICKL